MNNRRLTFVVARPGRREALVVSRDGGFALPCYDLPVPENVGFADPGAFNTWLRDQYGIESIRRYPVDLQGTSAAYFVQQALPGPHVLPEGCRWLALGDAEYASLVSPLDRQFLAAWSAVPDESATMHWASVDGFSESLRWMHECLGEQGRRATGRLEQVKNTYVSTVFRCPTTSGDVYLKVLPSLFIREAQVTAQLLDWGVIRLPSVIAIDVAHHRMLTEAMPGHDLIDCCTTERLQAAVRALATFQIEAIHLTAGARPQVFYDWTVEQLARQLSETVDDAPWLLAGSPYETTTEELSAIRACVPAWRQVCSQLQEAAIPDTLDHGDLRPGNIRVVDGGLIFYDWAWSAITHPFLSMTTFLHVARNDLPEPERNARLLRASYLEAWRDFAPDAVLQRTFDVADEVRLVYGVIADAEWLRVILHALRRRTLRLHPQTPGLSGGASTTSPRCCDVSAARGAVPEGCTRRPTTRSSRRRFASPLISGVVHMKTSLTM